MKFHVWVQQNQFGMYIGHDGQETEADIAALKVIAAHTAEQRTPLTRATLVEQLGALVTLHGPMGERVEAEKIAERLRAGAVLS